MIPVSGGGKIFMIRGIQSSPRLSSLSRNVAIVGRRPINLKDVSALAVVSSRNYSSLIQKNKGPFSILNAKILNVPFNRWNSSYPEHHRVTLPALSPTMEVGTIVSWEKKEGDSLSEGDLLCEIETDKATMGFETPEEGYLAKIILPAGAKDIPIGKLLCIIAQNQEDVKDFANYVDDGGPVEEEEPKKEEKPATVKASTPAASAPPPPPPPSQPKTTAPSPLTPFKSSGGNSNDRPFASPMAKKIAADKGIDLFQIKSGSGMDGMIVSKDVENFVPSAGAVGVPGTIPIGSSTQGSFTDAELSSMRKTIAKRLQSSKLEIPHYYLTVDLQMDELLKLRKEINQNYADEGIKLSVNDFIIKAASLSCKRVPACNSAWMGEYIREYHSVDVSVAVDTGSGLITPIVTGAENKGLGEISENIKELAEKAKNGKLAPHEFMGGTFTVSNLGMFGISHFTAIINPPQACILAVGSTAPKIVPDGNGSTKTIQVMKVTLSCDHRVVDGAVGAQWLKHFKKFIQQPQSMML